MKLAENNSLAVASSHADKNPCPTAVVAEYHFVRDQVASESWADGHKRVLGLLVLAANAGCVAKVERHERDSALPANDRDEALLKECRWFAMTHHVAIRLGSRRNRYGWFPPQLLILRSGSEMLAVLPCEIEGQPIEVEQFLQAILRGEAWTTVSSKPRKEVACPDSLLSRSSSQSRSSPRLSAASRPLKASSSHPESSEQVRGSER
jgi:hypothetical protein